MTILKDRLTQCVYDHFLNSGDYNGLSFLSLQEYSKLDENEVEKAIIELINDKELTVVYSTANPYIKAFPDLNIEQQIEYLQKEKRSVCLYPSNDYLEQHIPKEKFQTRPYDLELALGAGQLEFRSFDLTVLEIYRNDPRYYYTNDDIKGSLCVKDEYFESENMADHDQILLKTFGFSYDDNFNRAVAVFIRYLSDLSPEHQQIWKSKELKGCGFKLHPDYYRNSILGDYGTKLSLSDAFIRELAIINQMCDAMGKPNLFKNIYKENKPSNFNFLVRPTLNEYNAFVQTLDKMMSDNLNKNFFKHDLNFETEEKRNDGKIIVHQKGTIALLEEWCSVFFKPKDPKPFEHMILTFKKVRQLRQKPAHTINEDAFDQKYIHEQRDLLINAYGAIRNIRLMLANHPQVKTAEIRIPDILFRGDIWSF